MLNSVLTKKLLRDLLQRRLTLLALILVSAVGVSCYVGMAGVYNDLNNARIKYYQKYNLADFTVDLKRSPEALTPYLSSVQNILRLRSRIKSEIMVDLHPSSINKNKLLIPGVVMSLPATRHDIINNVKLIRGSWFSGPYSHEVIVDDQFAHARNLHIGSSIVLRLPDQQLKLLIVGTCIAPEYVSILPPGTLAPDPAGYAITYMPRRLLQQYANLNGSYNQLLGMVKGQSEIAVKNSMAMLSNKLDNYGVLLQTTQEEQFSAKVLHGELINVKKTTTFLPVMFLIIAALILNVMMNRIITQQRTAIGTLKAVGYGNFAILRHFLSAALLIGMFGGIVGILLGLLLQHGMLVMYKTFFIMPDMDTQFYFSVTAVGFCSSVLSALFGAISGAFKAMRIAPAEAMRPPTPEKSVHIILEKINFFWRSLSFQGKMVGRAIFRNRFRSIVTIAAAILATALVFSALSFLDSMYEMIDFSFYHVQHQDYTLILRDPLDSKILRNTALIPGVQKVEGQLVVSAELQN